MKQIPTADHSQYLKDSVGKLVAQGVAHVINTQPSDPVEYLGLWLLHQTQLEQVRENRRRIQLETKAQAEQYDAQFNKKSNEAASEIQSEVRRMLERKREQQRAKLEKQNEILNQERELRSGVESSMPPMKSPRAKSKKEADEDEVDPAVLKAQHSTLEARMYYNAYKTLMKNHVTQDLIKQCLSSGNIVVHKTMKCVLLLLDKKPQLLRNWEQVKNQVKSPKVLLTRLTSYDPETVQKKLKFAAIRRVLSASVFSSTAAIEIDPSAYILIQLVRHAVQLWEAASKERAAKNEPDEEEEDVEQEEFDKPDEFALLEGETLPVAPSSTSDNNGEKEDEDEDE